MDRLIKPIDKFCYIRTTYNSLAIGNCSNYGYLITQLKPNDFGWDGTVNSRKYLRSLIGWF
jgi:hypothetical protein